MSLIDLQFHNPRVLTEKRASELLPDLQIQEDKGRQQSSNLCAAMPAFVHACNAALASHAQDVGRPEGFYWNELVRELRDYCKKRRYPHKISKTDPSPSLFVHFFRALQDLLPAELRRHQNDKDSTLATYMARAVDLPGTEK
jgi:hypothetical protein